MLSPLPYSGEESCLETWALDNRWVPTEGGRDLRDNVFGAAVSHTHLCTQLTFIADRIDGDPRRLVH